MKKLASLLLALMIVFSLAACADKTPEQTEASSTDPVKPQVMYEGKLYEITDVTTGIGFEGNEEFLEVTKIDKDQIPEKDFECNLDAKAIKIYDEGGYWFLVVADGAQHYIEK